MIMATRRGLQTYVFNLNTELHSLKILRQAREISELFYVFLFVADVAKRPWRHLLDVQP